MYSLDELIKTFNDHAIEMQKFHQKLNEEDPERFKTYDSFCISSALLSICKEIKELKDEATVQRNK